MVLNKWQSRSAALEENGGAEGATFAVPKVKVIGVGGCGGNAVERMAPEGVERIEFIAADTDRRALESLRVQTKLQIGATTTSGLAALDPEIGRLAAQEDRDVIQHTLADTDMVFVIAGMGGGTGTGAVPTVARIARNMDIHTVAVATEPVYFENRHDVAKSAMAEIREQVDSLIAIPNHRLVYGDGGDADPIDMLRRAVHGIADIVIRPSTVHDTFADVRTVMSRGLLWMMGTGRAAGEDRARLATEAAIHSPRLRNVGLGHLCDVVVNVTAAHDLRLRELRVVRTTIGEVTAKDSTILIGVVHDRNMGTSMRVTVFAADSGATGSGGSGCACCAASPNDPLPTTHWR